MKTKLWNRIAAVLLAVCLLAATAPTALAATKLPDNAGKLTITASPSPVTHNTSSGSGAIYTVTLTAKLNLDPTVVRLAKDNATNPHWEDLQFTATLTYPTGLGITVDQNSITVTGSAAGLTRYETKVNDDGTITITGHFDGSQVSTNAMTCTGKATITGGSIISAINSGTHAITVKGVATVSGLPSISGWTSTSLSASDSCTISLGVTGGGSPNPPTPPSGPRDPATTGVGRLLNYTDHVAYMQGDPDGAFRPEDNVTRAEVAQIFYNALLSKTVSGTSSFSDVAAGTWYYNAVKALADLGIINGYGDGTFRPNDNITRAEAVTIATRLATALENATCDFTDVEGHWAYDNICTAETYGWVEGHGGGLFAPEGYLTRAEAATIVNRMLGRAASQDSLDSHLDDLKQFPDVSRDQWFYRAVMEATNSHNHTGINDNERWTGLK